jgi:sugar phosphate isomerase/epimerase
VNFRYFYSMISRRLFLQKASKVALALPLTPSRLLLPRRPKWGIILNTVREEMKTDWRGTLEQLATMGYSYLEGNSYGEDPHEYRRFAQSLGLKLIGGGSSMGNLQEKLAAQLRLADQLRHEYLTCYWPWLSSAENLTREECLETADRLNQLGKQAKSAGLRLTWHNHDKEFRPIGDTNAFELLLENTDSSLVGTQMDLYWVYKGGADPLTYFDAYPGRFDLVHVKDMADTPEQEIACVGDGMIDFAAIFAKKKQAGIRYAIVEQERSTDGIPCAKTSIDHLKQIEP